VRVHASTHGGRETARRRPSEGTDSTGSVPRYPPPLYMYKSLSMFTLLRVHASTHGGFLDSDDELTPTRPSAYFVRDTLPPTLCSCLFFGSNLLPVALCIPYLTGSVLIASDTRERKDAGCVSVPVKNRPLYLYLRTPKRGVCAEQILLRWYLLDSRCQQMSADT